MNGCAHKILFVILDHYKSERLGIEVLSSIALEEGYDRQLVILNAMPLERHIEVVHRFQPEIIAYSGMTFENYDLQGFNQALKRRGFKYVSIFGGHHYTFNPEEIINDDAIDAVCIGEGEEAFRTFIQCVRDGKEYHGIEKLWVRRGTEIYKNPLGTLPSDLDAIPYADRDLMPISDYATDHLQGKSMAVMIGRGCPHRCSYCFNDRYNQLFDSSPRYRYRSVDNVIRELKVMCERYQLDFITFYDDSLSYLPARFIEDFCRRYKKEINKPFCAMLRADLFKEDVLVMLKEAGLYLVPVGVECADDEVARGVLARGISGREQIKRSFALLHKHNIKTWSLNLMGLPVEDPLRVDWETVKFNMQLKPTWAQFNILLPIPKTPIFDYAVAHGYLDVKTFLDTHKMPSSFTKTQLKFKHPSVARRINNLHKFASILVAFPFLLPLVKLLILLPLTRLYQYIFFIWYGYWKSIGSFKAIFSFRLLFNGIIAIRQYLKRHR
jgi:anaerobic magnesium-protoporphyrin IX monomethyl ester cyclase